MMLSIVIVNYNVRYLLEQTLRAVFRSKGDFDYEVIVIDNASNDGSIQMVHNLFPQVKTIVNTENVGFSRACNQGIGAGDAKYFLLLNPDTILSEETLQSSINKMEPNERIGGLGVRMIDGGGHFLPESKRGLPTPFVAFCKAFGLSRLFPKSKRFNYYHLGHISEFESSEVDVLSGAYMMLRGSVLEKIGGLDETFFMYGEDIDLSYRIQKAGHVNWYEADTSIIHFKGESTKRGSMNYVRVFYRAMIIFAKKHFVGSGALWLTAVYQLAVFLRAAASVMVRFGSLILPVLVEFLIIFIGLGFLTQFWANTYFGHPDYYANVPIEIHHIIYTIVWVGAIFIGGAYDRYFSYKSLWKSLTLGTAILLIAFSLVTAKLRPSRAIVLLGAIWTAVSLSILRWVISKIVGVKSSVKKRIAIVGSESEIDRTLGLLKISGVDIQEAILVSPDENVQGQRFHGYVQDLKEIADAFQVDEVIFCAKDIEHNEIIKWMTRFADRLPIKIIQEEGLGIIGSRYKNKRGELYAIDAQMSIIRIEKKRQKRALDLLFCLTSLIGIPVLIFSRSRKWIYSNWIAVFVGQKTWVAYQDGDLESAVLPKLQEGVIKPAGFDQGKEVRNRINFLYAKDYTVWMDVEILWKGIINSAYELK
jgi:GT2 family glycosyltransferase